MVTHYISMTNKFRLASISKGNEMVTSENWKYTIWLALNVMCDKLRT